MAQPKTTSTIQTVLESINLLPVDGTFWLGGRKWNGMECNPTNNDYQCCTTTNPCVFGEGDCDSDDECDGNLVCGTDNCGAGNSNMDCCTTTAGTTVSGGDFLWIEDYDVVDSSNWAPGFPVSG